MGSGSVQDMLSTIHIDPTHPLFVATGFESKSTMNNGVRLKLFQMRFDPRFTDIIQLKLVRLNFRVGVGLSNIKTEYGGPLFSIVFHQANFRGTPNFLLSRCVGLNSLFAAILLKFKSSQFASKHEVLARV